MSALQMSGTAAIPLGYALLFSLALHAALLLGIGLIEPPSNLSGRSPPQRLAVTLSQDSAQAQPAPVNPTPAQPTSVNPTSVNPTSVNPTNAESQVVASGETASPAELLADALASIKQYPQQGLPSAATRPRITRLENLAQATRWEDFYFHSWRRKIEKIGNLNYPQEATQQKIYGSLRLMVTILPDGSLHEIRLLESSGHQTLDAAAIRIVRLAAPFAPFPKKLRETTDLLEIVRTWRFQKNGAVGSFSG